jgi:hypothetical protein
VTRRERMIDCSIFRARRLGRPSLRLRGRLSKHSLSSAWRALATLS